jgi:ADP-ribose pyrophosphatase YjhB (NUDIX family)
VKNGNRLYPDRPIVGCLAVVRRGGRVLLAQRSVPPGVGRWGFPGGMQELGETVHECARRELAEETRILADPVSTLSVFDQIRHDDEKRVKAHFTLIAVLLDWRAGEGEPIEDATALGWFTPEAALAERLELFPRALDLMQAALAAPR